MQTCSCYFRGEGIHETDRDTETDLSASTAEKTNIETGVETRIVEKTDTETSTETSKAENTDTETNTETGLTEKTDTEASRKIDDLKLTSTETAIILIVKENPYVTIIQLADMMQMSVSGIRYVMRRLREKGMITRTGSQKKGEWLALNVSLEQAWIKNILLMPVSTALR